MRAYEQALEELSFPQLEYKMVGGSYGQTDQQSQAVAGGGGDILVNAITGGLGQVVGGLLGMSMQQKQQEAQMAMQQQVARDQMLINSQLAAAEAQASQQHAANMPLYLLGGVVGIGVLGMVAKNIIIAKKR